MGAHGVRGVHGQYPPAQGQTPQQRGELGHLACLRADAPLGGHRGVGVGGGGEQVGDLPVGSDRAFDRFAVTGQRREQRRAGQWGADRAEPGLAPEVGAQLVGQSLGAQGGEDPLDGVGMRWDMPAAAVLAGAQAGQQVPLGVGDPVGGLNQAHAPGEHRRGAQPQDGGQRMANTPRAAGIGDRGETVQQAAAAAAVQPGGAPGQHRHHLRRLGVVLCSGHRSGQGHDRLSGQRKPPIPTQGPLISPVSYRGSIARTARHTASVINL